MTLREEIEQAVAYPLRQSEVADFRMDNMLDALEALVKNKVREEAERVLEAAATYADQWGVENEEGGYSRAAHSVAFAIRAGGPMTADEATA